MSGILISMLGQLLTNLYGAYSLGISLMITKMLQSSALVSQLKYSLDWSF